MKIILSVQKQNGITIQLKRGRAVIGEEHLTINRNLDNMLITAIDKLLAKNRIDRLSLKALIIHGKMSFETVSSMVIRTVKSGLEC